MTKTNETGALSPNAQQLLAELLECHEATGHDAVPVYPAELERDTAPLLELLRKQLVELRQPRRDAAGRPVTVMVAALPAAPLALRAARGAA
jgi:hypothetical protein